MPNQSTRQTPSQLPPRWDEQLTDDHLTRDTVVLETEHGTEYLVGEYGVLFIPRDE